MCLKCFNGGCVSEHSLEHARTHSHPLAVNIRLVQKPGPESTLITKVAINKEGGALTSAEYDTFTTAKCLLCAQVLDSSPVLTSLIDSILLSNSALFQASVDSWEKELVACRHTSNLQQVQNNLIAEKSLASCGECDLKSNLWLCMTCGHLGCGRKNYEGSGGNSHALFHFTSTNHPLVCKMGTITPEGTASIHCYTCDDEVLDPDLSAHLANFGIITKNLVKTEKTVTEMELEFNLNFTLSKAVEEGRVLTPRFGPGFTGLQNLGNTCYINAIIQTLFSIPQWVNRFLKPELLESPLPGSSFYTQTAKLVIGLMSGKYSSQKWTTPLEIEPGVFTEAQEYQDGIRPQMFKSLIGKGHPEFSSARQQDAYEFLQYFLTFTERQEKANNSAGLSPTSVFDFSLRTKVKCLQCQKVRLNDIKQNSISTLIPLDLKDDGPDVVVPWANLLKSFSDPEIVEFNCPSCQTTTPASKTYHFKSFPKVLILLVNRFVCPDWVPKKLACAVQIPTEAISLMDFAYQDQNEELLPEESTEKNQPQVNKDFLNQLLDMGMSEIQATNALLKTNNVSAEVAASWIFENLDNPELNQPLQSGNNADIEFITGMGFSVTQAKFALGKCDNNPERAIDYLFSHQDQMDVEEENAEIPTSANYQLFSVVTHLGASVHLGHYVAHILKNGEWVLFNDNKVAASSDPPLGKGYIYFFQKLDN